MFKMTKFSYWANFLENALRKVFSISFTFKIDSFMLGIYIMKDLKAAVRSVSKPSN